VLVAQIGSPSVDERHRIEDTPVLRPRQRHGEARPASGALALERAEGVGRRGDQCRPQHQIFRGIADEHELGKDDEVGAKTRGVIARLSHPGEITGYVADDRVQLRERDREPHVRIVHRKPAPPASWAAR
jgi:hypothetical protein